jgi:2-haloacid dehalogenase
MSEGTTNGARDRSPARDIVVFDLGGVLIEWSPRYLYRKLFEGDEAKVSSFLAEVCTEEWNERQDAGRTFAEAVEELSARHPDKRDLIVAFGNRFDDMIPGAIEGTVEILRELSEQGTPLYAITNWSAETFPSQRKRFPFLSLFRGIVVSGEVGIIKPDPRIFRLLSSRHEVDLGRTVFIDDAPGNAAAASAAGMHGIHFTSPVQLRTALSNLGLLGSRPA